MNLLMEWEYAVEAPIENDRCTRIRRLEQALMAHHEAVLRAYGLTMTQPGAVRERQARGRGDE
ncbi:hypothetical protein [Streptomyces platensis]|uniref:hypothetical protein n=1 Tax=Streptomyces platensis TaxID=58346 RepID=UPI003788226E